MTADDVLTLDFTRPCPVYDHHMDLSMIEILPWATRTPRQQFLFRCGGCGMTQTECSTISLASPAIAPLKSPGRYGFAMPSSRRCSLMHW